MISFHSWKSLKTKGNHQLAGIDDKEIHNTEEVLLH